MDKSLSATCPIQWRYERGPKSHVAKASLICCADRWKGEWDWCVRGDFRFINITFFLFNFLIFFVNSLIFSVLFFYTHTIYPKRFLFHKINILQLFSTYLFYFFFLYYFFTHDIYPHSRLTTSTHYPRHLATLINIWLIWVRQQKRRYNMDQNQEQVLF